MKVADYTCPECGSRHNGIVCLDGESQPSEGDVTVCVKCSKVTRFKDDGQGGLILAVMTDYDWRQLDKDTIEELWSILPDLSRNLRKALTLERRKQKEKRGKEQ